MLDNEDSELLTEVWYGNMKVKGKVKQSHQRPGQVLRDNRHTKVVRLSALRTGRLYPPPSKGNIAGTHIC